MKKIWLILLISIFLIGCKYPKIKEDTTEYQQGKRAYKLNIPANANPYIGTEHAYASLWLEGYMDSKEGDKK